jgi:hypothetical protein
LRLPSWRLFLADVAELASFLIPVSGTAIAIAFGKFLLALVLGGFAAGAWLRVKRGRVFGRRG